MIILTNEEAAKVRGISPTNSFAAIEPVPLKDGTYMLGEQVLADPAHADVETLLGKCARGSVVDNQRYGFADTAELNLRDLPTWQGAGKREAI